MRPNAQIKTQLKPSDGAKIETIVRDYGFRSNYEFVKTILQVFIKAYDPQEEEVLTENFRDIFIQKVDTKLK